MHHNVLIAVLVKMCLGQEALQLETWWTRQQTMLGLGLGLGLG